MRANVKAMLGLAVITAAGCAAPPPPPPPPAPVVYKIPHGRSQQVSLLANESKQLDQHVAALPGKNPFEHRKAMAASLKALSHAILLAAGDKPSLAIVNRRAVIDHATAVVSEVDAPPKRLAAAENEGIVAALGALQELAMHPAVPDANLVSTLDDAQSKLDSLQKTQGPLHELDATQTLASLATSLRLLSNDFSGNAAMAGM